MSPREAPHAELLDRLNVSIMRTTALATAIVGSAVLLVFLAYGRLPTSSPEARAMRITAVATLVLVSIGARLLARRGSVRTATALYVSGVFSLILLTPIALQLGVHSGGLPILAVPILLTGFLLHPRAGLVTTVVAIAAVLGLLWAQESHVLSGPTAGTTPPPLVMAAGYVILFTLVGWLTIRYSGLFRATIRDLDDVRRNLEGALESQSESEASFRSLFDSVEDAVYVQQADGRFITVNAGAARMYGHPREWFVGRHPADVAAPGLDDPAAIVPALAKALAGQPQALEFWGRRADGTIFLKDVHLTRGSWHGQAVVFALARDITARKAIEAELVAAKHVAESASRAKSGFLASMSHEIRTPMNGILSMAQLLLEERVSDEERRAWARIILGSGQTLLSLLNDILDLSKVEAGRIELERLAFAPSELLRDVRALFAEAAKARGLELKVDDRLPGGVRGLGDPTRLRQALSHFVSNAIKFTERGSVTITAALVGDGPRALRLSVTDTGVGIAEDRQAELFQAFSQLDSTITRRFGGTGLGLAITRSLVELMGGRVDLVSAPGRGSTFSLELPFEEAPREEAVASPAEGGDAAAARERRSGLSGKRVLVAEDAPTNQLIIRHILARHGLEPKIVRTGTEAVEAMRGPATYDLVLMDCQMPDMDGFEATRRIRVLEDAMGGPRVPIVALTAGVYDEDRTRCFAAGMDAFLAKPVDVRQLAATLEKYLLTGDRTATRS